MTGRTKPVSYTHLDVYKRQKCSGAKVGMPANCTGGLPVHSVSPMEKMPGSNLSLIHI